MLKLGIEKVAAKCLEKRPVDRYETYEELEEILLRLGKRHRVDLDRCTVKQRYERSQLGKGHLKQNILLEKAPDDDNSKATVLPFEVPLSSPREKRS